MEWKDIGPYRGQMIWARELPTGGWLVGLIPEQAGAPARTPPPENQILPAAFGSEVAATAAAIRFLDRQEERKNKGHG